MGIFPNFHQFSGWKLKWLKPSPRFLNLNVFGDFGGVPLLNHHLGWPTGRKGHYNVPSHSGGCFCWGCLENKLLLISINFTPKTSHSCLKKMVHYVFQVGTKKTPRHSASNGAEAMCHGDGGLSDPSVLAGNPRWLCEDTLKMVVWTPYN